MPLQSDQLNQKQLHTLIYLPTYVHVSGFVTFHFSFPIATLHAFKNLTHKRRGKEEEEEEEEEEGGGGEP